MEAGRMAIGNTGSEDAMRAELATAMGALVASADPHVRPLNDSEAERLLKLADITTWARSGVERDFHGGVIDAHAPEMPTRFAKQLAQVVRGALAIGLDDEKAMRLATRCARDSLEPLRRDLLLDVAANPDATPEEVHGRVVRPLSTVKDNLAALYTLRLLVCQERLERRGNRSFLVPHYAVSPSVDLATLRSM
jgi:hypothetical protein